MRCVIPACCGVSLTDPTFICTSKATEAVGRCSTSTVMPFLKVSFCMREKVFKVYIMVMPMRHEVNALLRQRGLDALVLVQTMESPDSSFTYFTGVRRVTGCFVMTPKKQIVFVSPLEYGTAQHAVRVRDCRVMEKKTLQDVASLTGKRIGMNFEHLSVNALRRVRKQLKRKRIVDASSFLREMRMVKRRDELSLMQKACRITDQIFTKVFRDARSVKTEEDMKALIEEEMLQHGVVPSFDPIVASGRNSAYPHHVSGKTRLRGMTIIDMGVKVHHYCSDITRTVSFGQPTRRELDVYHHVKRVQETCVQMVKAGERFSVIHQYAARSIGKQMMHNIGHGLGVDVHEHPYPGKERGDDTLKESMVITIEPGMYLEGKFGVRIEDDVVVGREKRMLLSKTGKELLVVS